MKIEVKKLKLEVSGGVKNRGGGQLSFEIENFEQEISIDELKEYLELIKEFLRSLK